jgi:hypothetical protein
MRQESNLQGIEARPGSGRVPSANRIAHPERMAEVSRPSPSGPSRVRAGGCASAASPSMSGERRTRIPAVARPAAFQAVPTPLVGSFSMAVRHPGYAEHHAESGRLERHGRSRALVSSEAQHPGWFTLPGTPGGICTLHAPSGAQVPETCASAFRHQRLE